MDMWEGWLLAAAALHLGFQATVSVLVYPVLVERGRRRQDDWAVVHAAHSRRIAPLVVLVYGALLPPVAVSAWRLLEGTGGWGRALAVAGAATAFSATAFAAAPAHGRLSAGWSEEPGRVLVRADVVRSAGAVTCLVGAMWAIVA